MNQRRAAHLRRQASVDHPRYPPQTAVQTQPQQQLHHFIQASDYESDTPANLSDYPSQPPRAPRTNEELNLSVLRRHNPKIEVILSVAPYAVVYEFSPLPEPTWSKTGVEGSLFINKLEAGSYGEDRYSAFVLNRRGLHNFEVELREGENTGVEITQEYVIVSYQKGQDQKINGIFIFSEGPGTSTEHTREHTADLMKKLAVQAGLSKKAAEAAAAAAASSHTNGNMQEAGSAAESVAMGRQFSLQQLFGQQRAEDAGFGVRHHNSQTIGETSRTDGQTSHHSPPHPPNLQNPPPPHSEILLNLFAGAGRSQPPPQPPPASQQSDVLMDLFRNVGLPKI